MAKSTSKPPPALSLHKACEKGKLEIVRDYLVQDHKLINDRGKLGRTPIMIAAVTGQKDLANFLIKNKCDLSLADERKDNVLHLACIGGNVDVVKIFLAKKQLNIESKGRFGQTPVMKSIFHGHLAVFDLLVSKKCELDGTDADGNNILHIACLGGHLDVVRHILSLKMIVVESKGQDGQTPLMMAASMGHKQVFDFLITKGAKLSGVDGKKDSILHKACLGDETDIAEFILSKNTIDINAKGWIGRTPIMKAAEKGNKHLFDLLSSKGAELCTIDEDGNNILHIACAGGNIDIVTDIVSKKAVEIESRGQFGRTPVMWTVYFGHRAIFEYLVKQGAHLSSTDDHGDNVLHIACSGRQIKMVKYLVLKNIGGLESRGRHARTPLMVAANTGDQNIFKFLVSKGCRLSVEDDDGDAIIHVACLGGDLSMVKFLLSLNDTDKERKGKHGRTPIMMAADFGQKDIFELLVKSGCNLKHVDDEGDNILHIACYGGSLDVVRHILQKNAVHIEDRGKYGRTAVMKAIEKGHRDIFAFLVSRECDLTVLDSNGANILHVACFGGDVEMVKCILGQDVVDLESRDKFGRTPLMKAVETGKKEVVDLMLERGSDLKLVDVCQENVLHIACSFGHLELVKFFLSLDMFDKESKGKYGRTPLMTSARNGHKDVFEFLLSEECKLATADFNGDSILHVACGGGNLDMVQYLLSENLFGLERRGRFGQTPLLTSTYFGHTEVFDVLVKQGANIKVTDSDKMNILHTAAAGGHSPMVKHILDKTDISKESTCKYERTPVMVAAEKGHPAIFDLLVQEGCNADALDGQKDNVLHIAVMGGTLQMVRHIVLLNIVPLDSRGQYGQTPLMKAASRGHIDIFDYLLSEGSDFSMLNADGDDVFHIACLSGSVPMVKHLFDLGIADKESRGKYSQTALMKAASMGHKDVFDLLVTKGCDMSVLDQDGDNVLHLACFGGNLDLVSFLTTLIGVDLKKKNNANQSPIEVAKACGHKEVVAVLEKLRC